METKLRDSGTSVIGKVPWGTHFCQFYQTKDDLVDILVPYLKAGLLNNEYCMWVTSEPLTKDEAIKAVKSGIKDFSKYLENGQIEILAHNEWYLKGGSFNMKRVLDGWVSKLRTAVSKGFIGMRVTGNTAWLEKNGWGDFTDYEEEINNVIGRYNMLALCTYSLGKCGAFEIIDVVLNHQFALIKRAGKWELIESWERKKIEDEYKKIEQELRTLNSELEKRVSDRTEQCEAVNTELKKKLEDLERIHKVAVGRELKMVELKQRIKELEGKL